MLIPHTVAIPQQKHIGQCKVNPMFKIIFVIICIVLTTVAIAEICTKLLQDHK